VHSSGLVRARTTQFCEVSGRADAVSADYTQWEVACFETGCEDYYLCFEVCVAGDLDTRWGYSHNGRFGQGYVWAVEGF